MRPGPAWENKEEDLESSLGRILLWMPAMLRTRAHHGCSHSAVLLLSCAFHCLSEGGLSYLFAGRNI